MGDRVFSVEVHPHDTELKTFIRSFTRKDIFTFVLLFFTGFAVVFALARVNFLLAHVYIELFSVAVAWTIFSIVWNGRGYFENDFFIFMGVVYLFVGIIDTTHTIAYKGMNVFRGADTNLPTQLWIVARYLEGLAFFVAPFFLRKKRFGPLGMLFSIGGISAVALLLVFSGYFPACHIEGIGLTPFKKISEYVISIFLLFGLWNLFRNRSNFRTDVLFYLSTAIITTVLAEMLFTFYIGVYDLSNLLGHYFKFISFYMLYKGVIVIGIREPFSLLARRLEERTWELEKSREDLRSTQRITSTMLDNLPEEISLLDLSKLTIIDANRTFIDNYGGNRDEIVGKSCYHITHGLEEPCNSSVHPCPLADMETLRFGKPVIHVHRGAGGEERYVEITIWEVRDKESGETTDKVVHIARDVTDRVRAQQLREDVERIVRHDLKSPLNGIIGGSELLVENSDISEEDKKIAIAINEAGNRVLTMVNQSLDMYKMAEGTYRLDPDSFNVGALLSRIADGFTKMSTDKNLSLLIDINGKKYRQSEKVIVVAEEAIIETMLFNLVQNAIEASPEGKNVTVHTEKRETELLFDIHNYGVIPESVRDRFFERYVTSGKRHGTGLGTYSAWLIAHAHGGSIRFTTGEKEGTHIYVKIPLPLQ